VFRYEEEVAYPSFVSLFFEELNISVYTLRVVSTFISPYNYNYLSGSQSDPSGNYQLFGTLNPTCKWGIWKYPLISVDAHYELYKYTYLYT